ncbi:MAG: methionyl-tRNA formyltransferase, partial [Anaerolineales bacterium]|nr:methionyl-tRNA formyltransferase [Anaerolineales bacterium]
VKVAAEAAGVAVYQPASLRREEAAEPLRAWQPDVIVVAAFGQILRPHVLELPPHGCVNVHASLLPRWRGASPIQHAILAGDGESGVSLMQMERGLDTGPVFVQEAIPLLPTETATTLHDKLAALGADMLRRHLADIVNGRLSPTPQDDTLATYAPMIAKENGRLDWHASSQQLDRQLRALNPWPGAFTSWQGELFKVVDATVVEGEAETAVVGQVLAGGMVQTGSGQIALQQVQPAGKRAMDIDDFLRGNPHFVGAILG